MVPTAIVTGCALAVIASGYLKLIRPGAAQRAIDAARLPVLSDRSQSARLVGAAELAIGLGAVAAGHWSTDTLLAALYIAFALFVDRLRRWSPETGCGCIGSTSSPPGVPHIVINVAAAIACTPSVAASADRLGEGGVWSTVGALTGAVVVALLILLLPGALERRTATRS